MTFDETDVDGGGGGGEYDVRGERNMTEKVRVVQGEKGERDFHMNPMVTRIIN